MGCGNSNEDTSEPKKQKVGSASVFVNEGTDFSAPPEFVSICFFIRNYLHFL
jgi:hypothetical protein